MPEFNYAIYKPLRKSSLTRVKLRWVKVRWVLFCYLKTDTMQRTQLLPFTCLLVEHWNPGTRIHHWMLEVLPLWQWCSICCYWTPHRRNKIIFDGFSPSTPPTSIHCTLKPFFLCDWSAGGKGSSECFLFRLWSFLRQTPCLWRLVSSLSAFSPSLKRGLKECFLSKWPLKWVLCNWACRTKNSHITCDQQKAIAALKGLFPMAPRLVETEREKGRS